MGPLSSSYISASAKERPARGKLLLLKNRREHNLDSSIFPSSMKLAFLVILLALEVFGEETELISDALVEEGINQLTSEISEDELKTLGQAGTIDFSWVLIWRRCSVYLYRVVQIILRLSVPCGGVQGELLQYLQLPGQFFQLLLCLYSYSYNVHNSAVSEMRCWWLCKYFF